MNTQYTRYPRYALIHEKNIFWNSQMLYLYKYNGAKPTFKPDFPVPSLSLVLQHLVNLVLRNIFFHSSEYKPIVENDYHFNPFNIWELQSAKVTQEPHTEYLPDGFQDSEEALGKRSKHFLIYQDGSDSATTCYFVFEGGTIVRFAI